MRELLIFLILLLIAIPLGVYPFILLSFIIGLYLLFRTRNYKFISIILTSPLTLISPVLGIVTIFFLIYFDEEEIFIKISSFVASLLVVFIIFPVLFLFITSPPACVDSGLLNSIVVSVVSATISTLIGISLALPLGYILARKDFTGKEFVEGIMDLPIVVPHTVAGIILLLVFGETGIIGSPFGRLGIKFYYALPGIIIAMLFVSVPFLVNQIREGIEKIDERYELVAMNLGASRSRAFFTVILPLIRRNIFVGSINSWARAMSEFGAVIMIAFYPMIAPTYIYFLYENYGLSVALPATSFLLLIVLVIFISLRVITGRLKNA